MRIKKSLFELSDEYDAEWLQEFEHILQLKLWVAYKEARRGKRKTKDEQKFEINADQNLALLRRDLMARDYTPSRSAAHIIMNPVPREIFAAPFRDRVVHHLIYDDVVVSCDNHFIYDSYSCREGKGTLMGIRRLDHHIRVASRNYADKVYIVKFDLKGYFMSLPRKELYEKAIEALDRQYKGKKDDPMYQLVKYLWHQVIFDEPTEGAIRKGKLSDWDKIPAEKSLFNQLPGIGIVIGNLTSQLLSNIYLDQLDRFMVYDLGYKHYGRYVDDFYVVVTEQELKQLLKDVAVIEEFLRSKKLVLHPKKQMITIVERGVPFLGVVVHQNYILPGERLKRNFRKACIEVQAGEKDIRTFVSYLGHVEHYNKIMFLTDILERIACDYNY